MFGSCLAERGYEPEDGDSARLNNTNITIGWEGCCSIVETSLMGILAG